MEMVNALQSAINEQLPFIIDFFDRYATKDDLYQLNGHMRFGFYQDIVILKQKVDEYLEERRTEFAKEFEQAVSVLENNPMMCRFVEREKTKILENNDRLIQWFLDRKIGGSAYEEYINSANMMEKKNIQLLAELGVNI